MSKQPPTPQEQIQQAIEGTQQKEFPLEVAIPGTPNVFRAKTPQEMLDQLVNAQTSASERIRNDAQRMQAMEQELQAIKAQIPPPPIDATEKQKKDYYDKWATEPEAAFDMQLAKRLGVSPDRVGEVLRRAVEGGVVASAAEEFLNRCPQFPQTQQAGELMRARLQERFGQTMEAATADNLELVFHELEREGRIVANQIPLQGVNQPNQPLPNLRGGSAPQNPQIDMWRQVRSMPIDKLKEIIENAHANGVR